MPDSVFVPYKSKYRLGEVDNVLNAFKTLAEYQERAVQQETALTDAFGQLRNMVAPEESQYMFDQYDNINQNVTNLLSEGNYRGAIKYAQQAAHDLINSPGIQGRIKSNQAYKEFVNSVQSSNKFNQDVKDWAIAMNPYSHEDIYDSTGRIIGSKEWKPTTHPVETVSLADLSTKALTWAKPNEGGSTGQTMFLKSDGTATDTYSDDVIDILWQTSGTWKRLGENTLREALRAAIESTPGAKESLHQDYVVANWQYDKLPEAEKRNIIGNDVVDANGRRYSEEEYLEKRIRPWLNASQINNTTYSINYGNGIATRAQNRAQQALQLQQDVLKQLGIGSTTEAYTLSTPISYDMVDIYSSSIGVVRDAINDIAKAMPSLARNPQWKQAVDNRDYESMINLVNNSKMKTGEIYKDKINSYNKRIVDKALTDLINNYKNLESAKNNLSPRQLNAVDTYLAMQSGTELPATPQSRTLYENLDRINNGWGQSATKFGIRFVDNDKLNIVLDDLGINTSQLASLGIEYTTENNSPVLKINKSNPRIFMFLSSIMNHKNIDSFWRPWDRTEIITYDDKGNETSREGRYATTAHQSVTNLMKEYAGNIPSALVGPLGKPIVNAATKIIANEALEKSPLSAINDVVSNMSRTKDVSDIKAKSILTTNTLMVSDIPDVLDLNKRLQPGETGYEGAYKRATENVRNSLISTDFTQVQLFGVKDNVLSSLSNVEKSDVQNDLVALLNNGDRVNIQFATDGVLKGYLLTVTPQPTDKYKTVSEPTKFFVSGAALTESFNNFVSDSKTVATTMFTSRKPTNGFYRDVHGNVMQVLSDDGGTINGQPASRKDIQTLMERDNILDRMSSDENLINLVQASKVLSTKQDEASMLQNQQVLAAISQTASTNAMRMLEYFGVTPPNPDDLTDPVNIDYLKQVSDYARIIVNKASR